MPDPTPKSHDAGTTATEANSRPKARIGRTFGIAVSLVVVLVAGLAAWLLFPKSWEARYRVASNDWRQGRLDEAEASWTTLLAEADTDERRGDVHCMIGHIHRTRGELDKAEEHYRKALEINERLGCLDGVAIAYGALGILYENRGDLDQAEEHYRKGLAIDERLGRLGGMADAYGNLGILYKLRGKLDQAEEHYRKGLAIYEKRGQLGGVASAYGSLGSLYGTRGELDKAEDYYRKALALNEKLGRLEGMASDYGNLGGLYEVRGDVKAALENWTKARDLFRKLGMPHMVEQAQGWIDEAEARVGGPAGSAPGRV